MYPWTSKIMEMGNGGSSHSNKIRLGNSGSSHDNKKRLGNGGSSHNNKKRLGNGGSSHDNKKSQKVIPRVPAGYAQGLKMSLISIMIIMKGRGSRADFFM